MKSNKNLTARLITGIKYISLYVTVLFTFSCQEKIKRQSLFINKVNQLPAALCKANPGDTIILKNGIYKNIGEVEISVNGTVEANIVFKAETAGEVVFTGKSLFVINGNYWHIEGFGFYEVRSKPEEYNIPIKLESANYNRITKCFILDCGKKQLALPIVYLHKSNHNRIDHNVFENFMAQGIQIVVKESPEATSKNNHIDHNQFLNVTRNLDNGGEAIQVGQLMHIYGDVETNTIIEHNLLDNVRGDHEIMSIKSSRCTIRYNQLTNCEGSGLWIRGGSNTEVYGNLMKNNLEGMTLFGDSHKVYNNYIEGCNYGIVAWYGTVANVKSDGNGGQHFQQFENSIIANNTIINGKWKGIHLGLYKDTELNGALAHLSPENNLIANNLIVGEEGILFKNEANTTNKIIGNAYQNIGAAKLGEVQEGFLAVELELRREGIKYVPQEVSELVDASIPIGEIEITDDVDGQPRNSRPDIGADEISREEIVRTFKPPFSLENYNLQKKKLRKSKN